jgi:RecG-like helicase
MLFSAAHCLQLTVAAAVKATAAAMTAVKQGLGLASMQPCRLLALQHLQRFCSVQHSCCRGLLV